MCRIFRCVVKEDFFKQEFVLEREFLIKYNVIVDQAQSRPVNFTFNVPCIIVIVPK